MNATAPDNPHTRDWIAVDQLVKRLLDCAPDDFERDVIRLAAETSGGPDTNITGGGNEWQNALDSARQSLQIALGEHLETKQPIDIDDRHPVRLAITDAVSHADLNDFDRDRVIDHLTDTFTTLTKQARENERRIIADWLLARANSMGTGGSVIVEEQARALASAAERLHQTLPTDDQI